MERHRLRIFENMMLRKMFGSKRDEVKGKWGDNSKKKEMDRACDIWRKGEVHKGF